MEKDRDSKKVYVMTKFKPFCEEEYVGVKKSQKEALKALREIFPHMRGKAENHSLSSDQNNTYLLAIHEEEI